jgi:hypothetical protein
MEKNAEPRRRPWKSQFADRWGARCTSKAILSEKKSAGQYLSKNLIS